MNKCTLKVLYSDGVTSKIPLDSEGGYGIYGQLSKGEPYIHWKSPNCLKVINMAKVDTLEILWGVESETPG